MWATEESTPGSKAFASIRCGGVSMLINGFTFAGIGTLMTCVPVVCVVVCVPFRSGVTIVTVIASVTVLVSLRLPELVFWPPDFGCKSCGCGRFVMLTGLLRKIGNRICAI